MIVRSLSRPVFPGEPKGIENSRQHLLVLFGRGIPKGGHDKINGVILSEGERMNACNDNGFSGWHLMERRQIKFDTKSIRKVMALSDLHATCLHVLRDNFVDLSEGLRHH